MKKVIFVDDEENVLKGLQRILNPHKNDYNFIFFSKGAEALKELESNSADVVVTDYKMPEMNGLELLKKVKEINANTKRVLLTGQSETEIYDKAQDVVHNYISKPCDKEELLKIIQN